ncbi:MAG: isoprenylcysteine carboxylmethyltransferase family protein [Bacteroidetes bacterium]|nr:isoprenylcysteine carboxylmethyltransferase family protein [Bacteroidota bacterium]
MTTSKLYPYFLVSIQLICLIFIAISGPIISNNAEGLLIECTGIFIALRAIYVVKIKNVNITPTVKQNSELITTGPYRIIRHPMYIAQLVAVLPLIIDYFSWYRLTAMLILIVILLVKIEYEEKQLSAHFTEYSLYKEKTKKMIPFVY